jgi:hypothetical protein
MKGVFIYIEEQLQRHGLSFALLACAVWYFYNVNASLQSEVRACNDKMIDIYQEQQKQLREVIDNNTRVLETIAVKIDNVNQKKKNEDI